MRTIEILEQLVGFRSVVSTPNRHIVGWIRGFLEQIGARVTVMPGPEGDRFNLVASLGPAGEAGYLLSGHMDVVAAEETDWRTPPFELTRVGERLHGRGAVDMKGFLAVVLSSMETLSKQTLRRPISLAFSYDEEAGCRGVPHLIAGLGDILPKPLGVIVGEPSGMRPVLAHKGKAAARAIIHGRSGHSSRPELGLNAIHAMTDVLSAVVETASSLTRGPQDPGFDPGYSTIQAGVMRGGQSVNIIPDFASLEVEARAIPGVSPETLLAPIRHTTENLQEAGYRTEWQMLSSYPALSLPPSSDLASTLSRITDCEPLAAVSYGTEAGLFQAAGMDAIICGPGDIGRAHRSNEFIEVSELADCERMIMRLASA